MIIPAFKHVLRAIVAAVDDINNISIVVASCLNLLLGDLSDNNSEEKSLKEKWLVTFLEKRFDWRWKDKYSLDLRKYAIMHGLCHKLRAKIKYKSPEERFQYILCSNRNIETVKINDWYEPKSKLSGELINAMIKTLGTYVKKNREYNHILVCFYLN